ncbi:MAG TPA: S8 family serine peptidase [Mycobacteriales bacterium]|nr:S8 family serine peptidase [Mycobacteriales bacterium]
MTLTRSRRFQLPVLAVLAAALSWMVGAPTTASRTQPMRSVIVEGPHAAQTFVQSVGGRITHDLPIIGGFSARVPASDVPLISRIPGVKGVMPDLPTHVQSTPGTYNNVPSVYKKTTGGVALANAGDNGQGVTVALIDTGVTSMPDIASAIMPVVDPSTLLSFSCLNLTDEPNCNDSYGHGTFMAGLIAGNGSSSGGKYVGMAPNAKIVSIKIAGASGASDVSTIIAAIQWVTQNQTAYNIRVLNLSLGTDSTQSYTIDPLDYAVEQAWSDGIVVNVAASNRGPAPGTISKPADDPFVLTVGAIDDLGTNGLNDDILPNFSGRGPTAADGLAKPDVVAPGGHIVSLAAPNSALSINYPSTMPAPYRRGSGTSMATAIVSGLEAQMLSANPTLSPDRVKYMLMSTAHPDASTDPMAVGRGIVDGAAALTAGPGLANVGVAHSTGTGSIAASRGTVGVMLDDTNSTVLNASSGDLTSTLTTLDTSGGSWYGGSWYGSFFGGSWYGGSWYGGSWYGGSWYGGSWYGQPTSTQDYGGSWYGGSWYGAWDQ